MARPESALSLELERSMNMQVRIETFEGHLRHTKVIDELDDERRKKSFNLNKWNKNMHRSFSKERKFILEMDSLEKIKKELEILDKKIEEFDEVYFEKRGQIDALEVQYETLDDEVRAWLLGYAVCCREKIRDENSTIEKKMIQENLKKKWG